MLASNVGFSYKVVGKSNQLTQTHVLLSALQLVMRHTLVIIALVFSPSIRYTSGPLLAPLLVGLF